MDTQGLSIDKKEEKGGLAPAGSAPPVAIPPMPVLAQNQGKPAFDVAPVGDVLAKPESLISENPGGKKRAFISAGERIDHWSKYLAIDWIYNAGVGAVFAYWGKFTESGQAMWSKPVDWGFTKILKPLIKDPAHLKGGVQYGNTFMSIIMGGMLTIPPLFIFEKKSVKIPFIKSIDRIIYGKEKVENDPKFQQAYDEIEHAPKKGFWAGTISRYVALAPLLASVLYKPSREWLKENIFSHVGGATKTVLTKVGLPKETLFKKFSEAERTKRWNYIHDDAIAMDLSFGLPYAVLHAFFYNMFANMFGKSDSKDNPGNNEPVPQIVAHDGGPAPQAFSSPAENGRKWTDATPKPAPGLLEKTPDQFVDKVATQASGEQQIV